MKNIEGINKLLSDVLDTVPLTEFSEPLSTPSAEMRYGLALVYGNAGFRKYIENEIREAIKNTALRSATVDDIIFGKTRALTLKELLIKSQRAFSEVEKINRATLKTNQEVV